MFYKVKIRNPNDLKWPGVDVMDSDFMLVEADNIRTARNLAVERVIEVEKATELELVRAGREGWPIIRESSETATDDGQQELVLPGPPPGVTIPLPEPHAQTADTGEPSLVFPAGFTPSTGSAPHWLPTNPVAQNTGG